MSTIVGRQEDTSFGGMIDVLVSEPDGTLIVIEPKRACVKLFGGADDRLCDLS